MKSTIRRLMAVVALLFAAESFVHARTETVALTFGSDITGTIALPGQQDRFSFTGTAGQRLYFDTLDYDGDPVSVALYAPSGVIVFSGGTADVGPFYLTETGTYRLVLDAPGDETGDYAFRLLDLADALPLVFGTDVSNQLNPRSQTAAYQFNGTAGQRVLAENMYYSSAHLHWRLIGPQNNPLFSGDISTSHELVLGQTGTYVLLFEGETDGVTPIDFRARLSLLSNPTGTATGFGVEHSGTTMADTTNSFSYKAPGGLLIYLDNLTNNGLAYFQLLDPNGDAIFSYPFSTDAGPYLLGTNGTYTLNVIGIADGDFHFRLLDLSSADSSSVSNLTFGVTYSGVLDPAFRTDFYRFTASPGQTIAYDALDVDIDYVQARMYNSSGAIVFFDDNADYDKGPFRITAPGTYYLAIESRVPDNTNDYSFRVQDLGSSSTQDLPLNTVVSDVLNPGSGVNWYRFTAAAGQRLYFDGAATNLAGYWYLFGPSADYITGVPLYADFPFTPGVSGTYLLAIEGYYATDPVPYSIEVRSPPTNTFALTLGATVNGAITIPWQQDRYTFTGAAGQKLYYDALDNDGDQIYAYLYYPDGSVYNIGGYAESDRAVFTLDQSGTYTLVLQDYFDSTGDYSFRLIDMAQAPVQPLAVGATVTGELNPGTRVDWYRLSVTGGRLLYFVGAATNGPGSWALHDANGLYLAGNSLTADFEYAPPVTGTYFIEVWSGSGTDAVPYSISVLAPNNSTTAYTLGTTVVDALLDIGEQRRYTFNGTAGQRLYYDAQQEDSEPIYATLLDAFGNSVFPWGRFNSDQNIGTFSLPYSGAYTLVLDADAENTGSFQWRLLDVASAPQITYGIGVTNRLDPQIETDLFRINGQAGQRIRIALIAASSPNANWQLLDPNNNTLLSATIQNSLGDITLQTAGTYVLAIEGTHDLIGTLEYRFRVSLLSSSNGIPTGFGVLRSGTISPGATNKFTFTGTAGLPIYLDDLTNTLVAEFQLLDPNGSPVFDFYPQGDSGPYILATNGTYTLNLIGVALSGAGTPVNGDFLFKLLNLTSSTTSNLTFGTTYTQTLAPPFRTDVYRFTGAIGQRLVYDSWQYQFDPVIVRLIAPSGARIFGNSMNADSEPGPFSLSESGTYYLIFENYSASDTIDYSFRLIDAAQAPALALAFNSTINGNLDPGTRSDVYRFTGTNGQHLYFDAMPTNGASYWDLYGPQNQFINGTYLWNDFDQILPYDGQYLLVAGYGSVTDAVPYSIRVVAPIDTTNALVFGATITGNIDQRGKSAYYTFTGVAGQRLFYDALYSGGGALYALLYNPDNTFGGINVFAETDVGPFTLTQSGTYRLRVYGTGDTTNGYSFRLLDPANAPVAAYDTLISGSISDAYGTVLYQVPTTPNLRLYFDQWRSSDLSGYYELFNPFNELVNSYHYLGNDSEQTATLPGPHVLAIFSSVRDPVPYAFQIVPANHAPVLASIGDVTIDEGQTVSLTANATDVEGANDVLNWSLMNAPSGASINPATGLFHWTPNDSQGPSTNTLTICVRDNGIPNLQDCKAFTIIVNDVSHPILSMPVLNGTNIVLNWTAIAGKSYRVQFKSDLGAATWTDLAPDVMANGAFASRTNGWAGESGFFRIRVLP